MKLMIKKISWFCTALFITFGASLLNQSALAHSLYVVAQYDGKTISGKSYYSDMTSAAETYVEAYKQGEDQPAVTGKTDNTGHFKLPIISDAEFKVVVEGEEGHRASIMADRISPQMGNTETLALLREDIAELKNKIYLQNILGGIGYIFGIVGIWAWLSARKTQKKTLEYK